MGNMSYCRFHNTSLDLQDCVNALDEDGFGDLSQMERRAANEMRQQCEEYIRLFDEEEESPRSHSDEEE